MAKDKNNNNDELRKYIESGIKKGIKEFVDKIIANSQHVYFCTHIAKYTESYSSAIRVNDNSSRLDNNIVCTSNVNHNKDMATLGGGEYLSPIKLHKLVQNAEDKEECYKILNELLGRDNTKRLLTALNFQEAPVPSKTDKFIKQVYFPVGKDEYHLLSVLPSTSLLEAVSNKMFDNMNRVRKINLCMISSNTAGNMGSEIIQKNSSPKILLSLPPKKLDSKELVAKRKNENKKIIPPISIDDIDGIVDGMCIDADSVKTISEIGKLYAGNYCFVKERCEEVKLEFLKKYGYETQPDGYEFHHIIPISQSGEDSADNMVLLSENDHKRVTADHKNFFKWRW